MKPSVKRGSLIVGALCLIVLGLIAGVMHFEHASGAQPGAPPDVEVLQVEQKDVALYSEWIGTLDGFENAAVKAQVTGYLFRQDYQEGAYVEKGQLLFEIDPRPFQAVLDQAEAQLAQAQAQLANAEATQRQAQLNVDKYAPLAQEQAASQQDLDNAVQTNIADQALVQSSKAAIQAAAAAVETAKINLGFTRLIAPINGIAGQAQLQVGALVDASSPAVTTVSTVDPIKVFFTVSEQEYLGFNRQYPNEASREEQEKRMPLQLILADGTTYPTEGKIDFADRAVDQSTGSIQIAGLFANPGNILRPGGYGRVRAATQIQKGALLIPQRAVTELQGGYQVAVLDGENKVNIQPVEVGERFGTQWIIQKGLKPGDRVIVEGAQEVHPGMRVNPRPFVAGTKEG
jgi:RND family efflux transporter MFP subunit